MSSSIGVVPTRRFATTTALALALCFWGTIAAAQVTIQPKAEVFAGYSWLHPGGYYTDNIKTTDHTEGVDESVVYYMPQAHNLGFLADFSQHFGSVSHQNINLYMGGLQFKFHTNTFSPFVHALVGAEQQKVFSYSQWNAALGAGGGFDYYLGKHISIRVVQADYIYSNFSTPHVFGTGSHQWNNARLSTGVLFNLGSYYVPQPTAACTAQPTELWAGDPVTVTATGSNFNPKHTIMYSWTTNGGRLSATDKQSAQIDTAGVAPGSYTANASLTDPKLKNVDTGSHSIIGRPDPVKPALCAANFTIKQPQPPVVSCSASPTTIAVGQSATITMTATDPQGWPMNYTWSTSGGQLSGSGTTATLTATSADAGTTMTVTGTATDPRANLSASCTATVNSPQIISCAKIEDWGECTFEKNPKKPWRVDNDCKDVLDKVALRLQQMPNGKLDVLGYTDEKEVITEKTLGAQRSVNVKYYLTTDGPTKIDPSRIQPRDGGTQGKATHFYFVAEGTLCADQSEQGTAVDESQVQPQSRNAPAPKKKSHKAKSAAPAASAPAQ